ncbi:hypothetical protein C8J55DRAFT_512961 [Lentinula edodes]|uniref:Uncharacterized protein n=1 Tax=Lentinula lateritia TaxID=40482 RepID=A0A9W9DPY2_9AGAR|nr:hypothetical protein C8J55DRAFT_512961 [Lentinula edodes]
MSAHNVEYRKMISMFSPLLFATFISSALNSFVPLDSILLFCRTEGRDVMGAPGKTNVLVRGYRIQSMCST